MRQRDCWVCKDVGRCALVQTVVVRDKSCVRVVCAWLSTGRVPVRRSRCAGKGSHAEAVTLPASGCHRPLAFATTVGKERSVVERGVFVDIAQTLGVGGGGGLERPTGRMGFVKKVGGK